MTVAVFKRYDIWSKKKVRHLSKLRLWAKWVMLSKVFIYLESEIQF